MAYRVSLTAPAEADLYRAFERIRTGAPVSAANWLAGLLEAMLSLREMPARCALVPEAADLYREVRHLIYGRRSGAYRILFDIREDPPDGPEVRSLRLWHGSRGRLQPEDLADDADS